MLISDPACFGIFKHFNTLRRGLQSRTTCYHRVRTRVCCLPGVSGETETLTESEEADTQISTAEQTRWTSLPAEMTGPGEIQSLTARTADATADGQLQESGKDHYPGNAKGPCPGRGREPLADHLSREESVQDPDLQTKQRIKTRAGQRVRTKLWTNTRSANRAVAAPAAAVAATVAAAVIVMVVKSPVVTRRRGRQSRRKLQNRQKQGSSKPYWWTPPMLRTHCCLTLRLQRAELPGQSPLILCICAKGECHFKLKLSMP